MYIPTLNIMTTHCYRAFSTVKMFSFRYTLSSKICVFLFLHRVFIKSVTLHLCYSINVCFVFFFCLFGVLSHSRIFHSYGDVTIDGEGLQIFTYALHSWSLSSEGSLACQAYCDTEHAFIMVIFEDL